MFDATFDAVTIERDGSLTLSLSNDERSLLLTAFDVLQDYAARRTPAHPIYPTVFVRRDLRTMDVHRFCSITTPRQMKDFIPIIDQLAYESNTPYLLTAVPGWIGKTPVDPYLATMAGNEVVHLAIVGRERAACLPVMVQRSPDAPPVLELSAYRPADELRLIQLHEPITPIGYCQNPQKNRTPPGPRPLPVVIDGAGRPMTRH